ncbi:cholesterol oxidase substrate-binding domain-containing protein [Streptomyces sp. NPDC048106]|uniref:cholesterol oxidase substrate-binding domain-containing protein n=1 Tax=Streptomyces sp. NPDC048106 TaxID=3155750 RepID=UPI00345281F1
MTDDAYPPDTSTSSPEPDTNPASPSRRRFLAGAAALAATIGIVRPDPAVAAAQLPDFPPDVELYRTVYRNWADEITAEGLWACAPADPDQVVEVVNWAWRQGWTVRARGSSHGWSPLTITDHTPSDAPVLLVDTAGHLTDVTVASTEPATVRAGTGITMEALLARLEEQDLGFTAVPATGDITLGGALAIDAHGTAVPALGEQPAPGHTYGSLSNVIVSLTAVVWDENSGEYTLRTFDRDETECAALLAHLGRSLVTEVVLRVGANQRLRCVSRTDIPASELFAAPGSGGRTLASFLDASGRAEAVWFAFTDRPWLKTWTLSPTRPPGSRQVTQPYNYPFSDNIPQTVADLVDRVIADAAWYLAPLLGAAEYTATNLGLAATASADIWGTSKNTLLYLRPTTLRFTTAGFTVLTTRSQVQLVVHEFTSHYSELLNTYAARGQFPVNGQFDVRVTGLDRPADTGLPGAQAPLLSALRPSDDHPEWDTAVWMDVTTLPGTPHAEAFLRELEQFLFQRYAGDTALTRVEWSKGWAYTDTAAWSDDQVIGTELPAAFGDTVWETAAGDLNQLDPHRVFHNTFLDRLLP